MKKKVLLMLAAIFFCGMTANAQNTLREAGTFTLQPKVGIDFGFLSGSWTTRGNVDRKTRVGVIAGVEGEYYVNDWLGIAAGLNYAQQGWKWDYRNAILGGEDKKVTKKLDYLNIPITADFYVAKGFALKAGIQFGFLVNAKSGDTDIKSDCEKLNFSFPIGLSYEYKNFVLDARYNVSATKVNKNSDSDNKWRSDLIQLTLGYKFEL